MKKLSLKGKFSFCMFVVMAIFFATEVILLGMQYYTKDRLGDLIDKSNRVYELKTTFSEVLSAYKYYSVSQKEDDREAAKEALERLRSDSASLRHVIFEDSYIREIDDLCHMADSLYEQIEPEIACLWTRRTGRCQPLCTGQERKGCRHMMRQLILWCS